MNIKSKKNYDEALLPASLIYNPDGDYADDKRMWQGIPAIERTVKGRLYVSFYSGMKTEQSGNFVIVVRSDDDGDKFYEPMLAVVPPTSNVRCFDECLWIDPFGKLWLFWAQSYGTMDGRLGVWASICDDADADVPIFGEPRRIANGIMMNKPIVLSSGEWLLTCGIYEGISANYISVPEERFSNIYISKNNGFTFELAGHTAYYNRSIDEHMVIERNDGSIWMLIRGKNDLGQAYSYDKGYTWTEAEDSGLGSPSSRFCIRRLKSGRMLLINHHNYKGRNNLKAMLSNDEGETWYGYLMIDERSGVSYPDMTEDNNGNIYITYDYDRYTAREIYIAKITEKDITAGRIITESSFLKRIASKAKGEKNDEPPVIVI